VFSVGRLVSRRCHNISAMRRFVPGSSQNRTWSVTPSGSQFESSTVEQGRGHVFPHPIDSGRLASILALEAFTQPFRIAEQPHQGVEPHPRLFACHPCETLKFGCHGQSPLGVGPCLALALSQTATPLLGPHYQASSLSGRRRRPAGLASVRRSNRAYSCPVHGFHRAVLTKVQGRNQGDQLHQPVLAV
jgi:hypothetical protein